MAGSFDRAWALVGAIRIPDTVGLLVVTADLRAGRITCLVDIEAPGEGRPTTRVNWLVRQLKSAPDDIRVEAYVAHARGAGTAELLKAVREDSRVLVTDPAKELRMFRVALSAPMGAKRGRGRGSFIDATLGAVDTFYGEVMQHRKAWSAAPPRLRPEPDPDNRRPDVPVALVSTALSSQDGAETVIGQDGQATVNIPDDAKLAAQKDVEVSPRADGATSQA